MYCGEIWKTIWSPYNSVRSQVQVVVCVMGCLTNVLNLLCFLRKRMRNPTNTILSALACTDFLCNSRQLIDIFIYSQAKNSCVESHETSGHFDIAVEFFMREIGFYVFHAWSVYLTVIVATWRFIGIIQPLKSRRWLSSKNSIRVIILALGVSTTLIPLLFLGVHIKLPQRVKLRTDTGVIIEQVIPPSEMTSRWATCFIFQSPFGENIFFWTNGLLIKIFPCIAVTLLSIGLIMSLRRATNRRRFLVKVGKKTTGKNSNGAPEIGKRSPNSMARDRIGQIQVCAQTPNYQLEFNSTTKMICVFLLIFIFTELPPGILQFLSGLIESSDFYAQCYDPIGHFLNLNEYLSSISSFFVYVLMSRNFRLTLVQCLQVPSFWNYCCPNWKRSLFGPRLTDPSSGKFDLSLSQLGTGTVISDFQHHSQSNVSGKMEEDSV